MTLIKCIECGYVFRRGQTYSIDEDGLPYCVKCYPIEDNQK